MSNIFSDISYNIMKNLIFLEVSFVEFFKGLDDYEFYRYIFFVTSKYNSVSDYILLRKK
jgi:hypothetical protein